MSTLLAEKQKKGESTSDFVKRFRNRSLHSREAISEATLLEMCRNNISIKVLSKMGAVETRSWKELVWQGEQAEIILKRIESEEPQPQQNSDKQRPSRSSSNSKGKDVLAIETTVSSKAPQKQKGTGSEPRFQKHYDFKEDQVVTIFKSLLKGKKIKLPEVRRPEDANKTDDPNFCLYHRMVNHATKECYILKDKIQALLDANVMTLKPEEKKVTTNMVTLEFGKEFPSVPVPVGPVPIPRAEMRIINLDPHHQQDRGLVQYTTPSGQIMWVHPDLLGDMQ